MQPKKDTLQVAISGDGAVKRDLNTNNGNPVIDYTGDPAQEAQGLKFGVFDR